MTRKPVTDLALPLALVGAICVAISFLPHTEPWWTLPAAYTAACILTTLTYLLNTQHS